MFSMRCGVSWDPSKPQSTLPPPGLTADSLVHVLRQLRRITVALGRMVCIALVTNDLFNKSKQERLLQQGSETVGTEPKDGP